MADTISKNNLDIADHLNKKYGIETFSYEEEDLDTLKDIIYTKMAENLSWKREWIDDHLLKRFLRTFETVSETVEKLTGYFEWRSNENIDGIDPEDPIMKEFIAMDVSVIVEDFYDRCGRPILLVHTARQKKEVERAEYVFRRAIYFVELMCERSDKSELRDFCVIFNLDGFSTANMDFAFLQRYINSLRDHYPERIGVALVINYPSIVYPLWKIVKLWMDRHLRSKFIFCGKEEFNDFIDVEKMPVNLFAD